jgi:hypothetical protein
MTAIAGWENFYVIVGSSAGALIGLQFVVMTLISDLPGGRGAAQAGSAFSTPTIVHFGSVLLLSAMLNAPWRGVTGPSVACGLLGLAGTIYVATVAWRMAVQTLYRPELEDWLFHALLPLAAYVTLAVSAFADTSRLHQALFAVAAAALLLLFSGIHNAWDAVTYHVFHKKPAHEKPPAQS